MGVFRLTSEGKQTFNIYTSGKPQKWHNFWFFLKIRVCNKKGYRSTKFHVHISIWGRFVMNCVKKWHIFDQIMEKHVSLKKSTICRITRAHWYFSCNCTLCAIQNYKHHVRRRIWDDSRAETILQHLHVWEASKIAHFFKNFELSYLK